MIAALKKIWVVLRWLLAPAAIVGAVLYYLYFIKHKTVSFPADYEKDKQKTADEVKKEPMDKTLDFLRNWFASVVILFMFTGCGLTTVIIPEPPLVPQINFPDKVNGAGKIELEPYDAKMLKIYLIEHGKYRVRLFELFEKL